MAPDPALGQDIRATSAALHYYAQNKGAGGKYGPVTRWEINETHLIGTITVPTPVSVVGRVKANPSVADNFLISKVSSAKDLGQLMACVGLAANFSAINALVGKGIIEGHMRLHNQANIKVK
ncbi:MAG: hypothetical protein VW397_09070 [Candidatus Margulisiibacteriota bacterium]